MSFNFIEDEARSLDEELRIQNAVTPGVYFSINLFLIPSGVGHLSSTTALIRVSLSL
jgi:hypothetical protein